MCDTISHHISIVYRISHNALLHGCNGAGPSRSPDSLPWPAQWLGIQYRLYGSSSPRPIIFRISANATHRYQDGASCTSSVRPVSVQCPCAPLGMGMDGDGWGWIQDQQAVEEADARNVQCLAYQGHLLYLLTLTVALESWQFMLDHFQCSNVCQGDRGTPMRHQLQPQIQVLPRLGESAQSRGQGRLVMPNTYCSQTWPTRTYSNLCWSSWASAAAPPPTPSPQRRPQFRVHCHLNQMSRRSTSHYDHTHQHTQAHTHMLCAVRRAPLSM